MIYVNVLMFAGIIALVFNAGIIACQLYTIIKRKKNPLTDELYDHLSESKKIKAENY
jgi:hypothetical protein